MLFFLFIWIHDEFFVLFKLHYIIVYYRDILGLNHHVFRPRRTATFNCNFVSAIQNNITPGVSLYQVIHCFSHGFSFFLLFLSLILFHSFSFTHPLTPSALLSSSSPPSSSLILTVKDGRCRRRVRHPLVLLCLLCFGTSTLIRPGFVLYNVSYC